MMIIIRDICKSCKLLGFNLNLIRENCDIINKAHMSSIKQTNSETNLLRKCRYYIDKEI